MCQWERAIRCNRMRFFSDRLIRNAWIRAASGASVVGGFSMKKTPENDSPLRIEEVRVVSDLRIMHSKVNELFHAVSTLKRRHSETAIRKYSDKDALEDDIKRVDEIYLWFVALKEQGLRLTKK